MSPLFIVPFYPKNTSQLERYAKIHKTISIPYVQHQMSFSTPRISSNNLPWYQFLSHNMKASHGASSLPQSPHQGKTWENDRKPTNGWSSVCENLSTSTLTIRHLQVRPVSAKMAAINQKSDKNSTSSFSPLHVEVLSYWEIGMVGNCWGWLKQ